MSREQRHAQKQRKTLATAKERLWLRPSVERALTGRLRTSTSISGSSLQRSVTSCPHTNWLMDNGDSGPGAQWEAPDLHEKLQKTHHILMSFDGARRRNGLSAAALILWLCEEYLGSMTADREALRMGIERLTVLIPTQVSLLDFQVGNSGRTVQNKLDAQSLRLFGLHSET